MRFWRRHKGNEPLQPDERMVFAAALSGDGPGIAALRAQAERGFSRGLARHSFSFSYQLNLNLRTDLMSAEAIPGLPSVDIDDVVVQVEELPGSLIARAVVHEGMLSGLYVWADGLTDYPRHLTFTDVRHRQQDGSEGPLRDPRLLDEFERQLAPSLEVQPAPDWLRELAPVALRPSPRPSASVDEVTQSAHPDTGALALWLQAQDLGDVRLLSGSEFFTTEEGEVLVANGLDGSAYTVTPQGRVRHYPLDEPGSEDLGTLRGWLRRLQEDDE